LEKVFVSSVPAGMAHLEGNEVVADLILVELQTKPDMDELDVVQLKNLLVIFFWSFLG
jgi:hypothetical protein